MSFCLAVEEAFAQKTQYSSTSGVSPCFLQLQGNSLFSLFYVHFPFPSFIVLVTLTSYLYYYFSASLGQTQTSNSNRDEHLIADTLSLIWGLILPNKIKGKFGTYGWNFASAV